MPQVTDPALLQQLNGGAQAAMPQQAPREDIVLGRDPYKTQDQAMQVQSNDRANAAADRQAAADERAASAAERAATKDASGTVDEKKIATLLTRISGGFNDITNVTKTDPSAQEPGLIESVRGDLMPGGVMGVPARAIAGASRRTVHDSQRDVLDALLTLGTGAAYSAEQLSGQMAAYFPQYNDSPEEIAVKNQRMARIIEAAKANAGPAWAQVEPAIAPYMQGIANPQFAPPNVATVKDGRAFDKDGKDLGPVTGGQTPPDGSGGGGGSDIPISQDLRDRAATAEQMATGDQSGLQGLSTLAQQGITLGLADEAAGVGGFLSSLIQGQDPRAGYVTARDARRGTVDKARQEWGLAGTAAEFAGGGGAVKIAGGVNSLLQASRQGATLSGIAGFGSGEGAQGSGVNALIGAGAGGALGTAFQAGGNALANRAARGRPDMAVVEAGQRQNIPIRQPDARPELRGEMAQAESTQSGGPIIRQAREADTVAVEARIAEVGGQGNPSDPYALGARIQGAGQRYIAKTKAQANRLYDRARELSGNATVTAKNADAALDANIQELRAAGENSNAAAIKYLEGLRTDIDRGLSLESVQNLRTNMRGQIGERGLTGTDTERRVGQVIDAMNNDLADQLPPEASQALRAADSFYKERQEFIKGTLKQFMGDRGNALPAETAAQRLVSMAQGKGNYERFNSMWKQLEPAEQADVSATIAASLGRKANGDFSLSTLIKSLDPSKGINPRTARTVFGEDGAKALQDLRVIASAKTDAMGRQSPSGVAINGAAGGLKTLLWGALGMAGAGPGGAAAGAVGRNLFAAWGEQRAARMLLNPDFTKWLRNMPQATNPQAIDRYMGRLATIQGIAANDNKAFQQAIMQAFKASPGRAAADEEANSRREPPQ